MQTRFVCVLLVAPWVSAFLALFIFTAWLQYSPVPASFDSKSSNMSEGNAACNFHMRTTQMRGD